MMIGGCVTTEAKQTKRVVAAASAMGKARAQSSVPELPPDCREHMKRIYPTVGEKFRGTQLRWEYSADQVDALIDRCAQFHGDWAGKAQK
jgi:hypothetical protein